MLDCTVIVFGASGDLAKKKTFPSLANLFQFKLIPPQFKIIGYARSNLTQSEFKTQISNDINVPKDEFLNHCEYFQGEYSDSDFDRLAKNQAKQTICYLALPPNVFIPVCKLIHKHFKKDLKLIVEKPFGRDSDSSQQLSSALSAMFSEKQIYRIDHYLGKEMVKNLFVLRFANTFFRSIWNAENISTVQITFKEPIGVEGRAAYFDKYGIVRDVMQNHLIQVMSLVAMEEPSSQSPEAIRDAKVKVLESTKQLSPEDCIFGQYKGYLNDPQVPSDSHTPTFAIATFSIENERWKGVPFILKCGKALNERKAEIRIQFKQVPMFKEAAQNELVIRLQPKEAVYMKFVNKKPGLGNELITSELDLSYHTRYSDIRIPDAYESLIYDVLNGDQSSFVRSDELTAAWRIFDNILENGKPVEYERGTRGPEEMNEFVAALGYKRTTDYRWSSL